MNRAIARKNLFIHRFKTDSNYYIYDVNSNRIHRVDGITYKMIGDYGILSHSQIVDKYKNEFTSNKIRKELQTLEDMVEKEGIFSVHRPKIFRFDSHSLKRKLNSNLEQIILNVTDQCNMRCKYCIFSGEYPCERTHSNQFMGFKIAKRAVDFYFSHSEGVKSHFIGFYGGEPLLNFDLIKEVAEYATKKKRKSSVHFNICTNGILLSQKIVDFLIQNDFFLSISLNGPKNIHDRYRVFKNGKGSFDILIHNLMRIKENNEEYYKRSVRFMVTIVPPYDLLEVEHFFSSFELMTEQPPVINYFNNRDTTFLNLINFVDSHESKIKKDQNSLIKKINQTLVDGRAKEEKFVVALYGSLPKAIAGRNIASLQDVYYPHVCIPGTERLFVSAKGKLFICEKVGEHCCIGDIDRGFDFDAVLKLMNEYLSINKKYCLNCWALRFCNLCYVHMLKGEQLISKRMRESCKQMRKETHKGLTEFTSIMEKNPDAFNFMKHRS
jgi:uncharacterized protein